MMASDRRHGRRIVSRTTAKGGAKDAVRPWILAGFEG
jgi:hypothetical protein